MSKEERTLQSDEELNQESEEESEETEETPEEGEESESKEESTGGDDDSVTLSKEEHQKLIEERDNYKKVALAAKKKKKEEPKEEEAEPEYLTVGDRYKAVEREAISASTTISKDDSEDVAQRKQIIDDKWDEIKDYIPINRIDKRTATQKDIEQAIVAGYGAWKESTGFTPEKDDTQERAELAAHTTKPAASGKETEDKKPRKRLIPKAESMKEWYGKSE